MRLTKRVTPTMDVETALLATGAWRVAGMDEVGRGSLFGPCWVGLVVVEVSMTSAPAGLADSKALSPREREALVQPVTAWAHAVALGGASAAEIDEFGLTLALRLAGRRALATVTAHPDVVILDGSFDWLSRGAPSLIEPSYPEVAPFEVHTKVGADRTCATVAAASILAKVHRDQLIVQMASDFPGYDLAHNKGYATPAHLAALRELGPSTLHRRSWRLPTPAD